MTPAAPSRHILLADDDKDDVALFAEALAELSISAWLTTISNGEQLLQQLKENQDHLPDVLFLDLNLPRKNGFDCLSAIKHDEKLQGLTVVIFTTSSDQKVINLLYENGAQYYIRKPTSYGQLRNLIQVALTLTEPKNIQQPSREHFVLSSQPVGYGSK